MRADDPPEEWLVKAWDGDVLVDLIFSPKGLPIDDEVIARGDDMSVLSMEMRVMAIEDVLITKLMAITSTACATRACWRSPARCASRSTGSRCAPRPPRRRSRARSSCCSRGSRSSRRDAPAPGARPSRASGSSQAPVRPPLDAG